jgi:hypothetical protein
MPPNPLNLPPPEDRQTVVCLYCGASQEVGKRTLTMTCKQCHKALKLEDITISRYEARRQVDTCGVVVVEKKGQCIADRILAGGLVVRGKVKGTITSRGPVLVGAEAEVKGDVTAPSLAVGAGAVLQGQYTIGDQSKLPRKW